MNTDNSALLISFGLIVYFIFCFFQGKNGTAKQTMVISDNYQIGYVENNPQPHPYVKVVEKQQSDKDLKNQCFKIMVAIGYSEQAAKEIIRDFFKKNTANSLEDFFVKINKS